MNKRGSHIGIVLSFVIFITFLTFAYIILEPEIIKKDNKESILDSLELNLLEKTFDELTSISVMVNKSLPQECVEFVDFVTETSINKRIKVKDERNSLRDARIVNDVDLHISRESDDYFFKIYNSDKFEEVGTDSLTGCGKLRLDKGDYYVGSVIEKNITFESKIKSLLEDYETDYENLKNELNVPYDTEFGFSFKNSEEVVNSTEVKNVSVDVYAREIPIQYIDEEANTRMGVVKIWVW